MRDRKGRGLLLKPIPLINGHPCTPIKKGAPSTLSGPFVWTVLSGTALFAPRTMRGHLEKVSLVPKRKKPRTVASSAKR